MLNKGDRVTFDCSNSRMKDLTGTYVGLDGFGRNKVKLDTPHCHTDVECVCATNLRKIEPVKYTITRDGEIHTTSTFFIGGLTAYTQDEANRIALGRCLDLQKTLPARIAELQAKVLPKFALDETVRQVGSQDTMVIQGVKRQDGKFRYLLSGAYWTAEHDLQKVGN